MSENNITFNDIKINKSNFYKTERPLCVKLPQMIGYVKCFHNNKTMSFKIVDYNLLKKYTKLWERVSDSINI